MVKVTALLLSLLITTFCSLAGPTDYLMDVWTSDDELPDSSVTSIAQTPDGYLWIGTYNGLARFDGVRFVTFDPVNTPELKNARVTGLFVDVWGTLWISTYDGSMTSLRNGVFTHEWQGDQAQGDRVFSVFSTSNQVLFALAGHRSKLVCRTETGERHGQWQDIPLAGKATGDSFIQDGKGDIWYLVNGVPGRTTGTNSELFPQSSGWRGKIVRCLTTDSDGHIWAGTDQGVACWNNGRFEDWTPTNGEPEMNVFSLACTRNGCWVFADGKVRKCVDRRWVAEVDAKSWRDLVGTFRLDLNAHQDRDGGMWFTHLGLGLFHIKADGGTEHFSTDNGLPSDLASCWFQDREGNIWVGLNRGGLVRLRKKQFQVIGPAEGLGAPAVSSVCEDGQSNVWIGTFSGGLYRWRNGELERFTLPDGAYRECFFSAYPDSRNRLWLSAGREDLFTLENGRVVSPAVAVHGIKAILVDRQGRVWLGKPAGLTCLTGGMLNNFPATNGLNDIRALAEDPQGGIWIGTGGGNLFHYENGSFARYQTDDGQENRAIWSLLPEADGTLWVGTFRGGLLRFKDGKFTRYMTQDGLPSDIICQILDDGLGKLWIGSHRGIFYVPKNSFKDFHSGGLKSLPCVAYGLYDGLPTLECSGSYQPACWRGHDGRLWFATAKGVVSVLPGELSVNHLPPPVIIEGILVDGKPLTASNEHGLSVLPGKHQFDFRYTALSFTAPDKVAFRYKLEGLDENWIDGGTKRSVHYGPLPPGEYRFQVIACNNDGVWNKDGAAVAFEVLPQFYETGWFRFLVVLAGIAAVAGTVRYIVVRRMRRDLERLDRERMIERDRSRIARDIHDDLGSGLTRIMLQSEMACRDLPPEAQRHLGPIADTARSLTRALDEIVWAVDPEEDTLSGLINYVTPFAEEFLRVAGIRFRIDLPDALPPLHVDAESRYNLFLVLKESLNNIVKHAHATEVWLRLRAERDGFKLILEDNGQGLPETSPDKKNMRKAPGHGLMNLEKRMLAVGGKCEIQSLRGTGTRVEITVRAQAGRSA